MKKMRNMFLFFFGYNRVYVIGFDTRSDCFLNANIFEIIYNFWKKKRIEKKHFFKINKNNGDCIHEQKDILEGFLLSDTKVIFADICILLIG